MPWEEQQDEILTVRQASYLTTWPGASSPEGFARIELYNVRYVLCTEPEEQLTLNKYITFDHENGNVMKLMCVSILKAYYLIHFCLLHCPTKLPKKLRGKRGFKYKTIRRYS